MDTELHLAGTGPAAEAVVAALGDVGVEVTRVDHPAVGDADLAVAVDRVGGDGLPAADRAARSAGTPLVAVELGGIGGRSVDGVEAAVAGFLPATACYDCLRTRVAAGLDGADGDSATDSDADSGADADADADADGSPSREGGPVGADRYAGALAGREAARLVVGDPSRLVSATPDGRRLSRVAELPAADRPVLPVPGCDCADSGAGASGRPGGDGDRDGDADAGDALLTLTTADRDVEAVLDRAELAVDDRVGPIAEVGEAESFPAPYYLARLADTTGFSDVAAATNAGGLDPDWDRAFVKALGEGLERYAAGVYRRSSFRSAPPGAVAREPGAAVGPGAFVRPHDAPTVDPEEPIPWERGVDLESGDPTWLPAEAVRFPPPEERYLAPITTGLGLGSSTVEALCSGLYEVVERDAAVLAWYSTYEPIALRVDHEGYRALADRVRSEDLRATAVSLTVDVDVPVVGAAVHGEEWPRIATGLSAHLDPGRAAAGALAEAVQNWTELASMGPDGAGEEPTAIGRYAGDPGPAGDFFDPEDGPIPAGSLGPDRLPAGEAHVEALVDRVTDAGLSAYAADLTTRDVETLGFAAVRVLVPGAQPLFVDVDRPAFGDRAREVPRALGFEPDLDGPPHPYP